MTSQHKVGLLDTCVLFDVRELPDECLPVVAKISTVTLAEVGLGIAAARNAAERLRRTEQMLEAENLFEALPFTSEAARRFTSMAGLITSAGRSPRPRKFDLMIGAVASVHDLPLYTRNAKDFEGLDELLTVIAV